MLAWISSRFPSSCVIYAARSDLFFSSSALIFLTLLRPLSSSDRSFFVLAISPSFSLILSFVSWSACTSSAAGLSRAGTGTADAQTKSSVPRAAHRSSFDLNRFLILCSDFIRFLSISEKNLCADPIISAGREQNRNRAPDYTCRCLRTVNMLPRKPMPTPRIRQAGPMIRMISCVGTKLMILASVGNRPTTYSVALL